MRWKQAERLWEKWDRAVDAGETPHDILPRISDESLVQLLLTTNDARAWEKDVIAEHLLNRLRWSRGTLRELTDLVEDAIRRLNETVEEARPVVHRAERIGEYVAEEGTLPKSPEEVYRDADAASENIERVRDVLIEVERAVRELVQFRRERLQKGRPWAEDDAPER